MSGWGVVVGGTKFCGDPIFEDEAGCGDDENIGEGKKSVLHCCTGVLTI